MKQEIPWTKLGKFIAGEVTPEERKEVERWINTDPIHADLFEKLQDIWNSKQQEEWDVDSAWENLSDKIDDSSKTPLRLVQSSDNSKKESEYSSQLTRNRWWGLRIAVSFLLILGLLLTLTLTLESTTEESPEVQELIVKKGQRSQFKLSDGTKVWLNSDSRMKVPAQFNGDHRRVYLEGEAFFDVEKNSNKPFLIHAGESITKVLGTQFNLKAYPEEKTQVIVKEGKVAFGNQQKEFESLELEKNQMGVLTSNELKINEVESLERFISWKDGKLILKDTPLYKVARVLERKYNIDCVIEDSSLKNRTITASFEKESIKKVLNIITLSIGISYEKDKRTVRFFNSTSKQVIE